MLLSVNRVEKAICVQFYSKIDQSGVVFVHECSVFTVSIGHIQSKLILLFGNQLINILIFVTLRAAALLLLSLALASLAHAAIS